MFLLLILTLFFQFINYIPLIAQGLLFFISNRFQQILKFSLLLLKQHNLFVLACFQLYDLPSNKLLLRWFILYFLFFFFTTSSQHTVIFSKNVKVIILFNSLTSCMYVELNVCKFTSLSIISLPLTNTLQGKCFSSSWGYYSTSSYILSIY